MHEINYDIFELIFNFVPDKLSVEIVDVWADFALRIKCGMDVRWCE